MYIALCNFNLYFCVLYIVSVPNKSIYYIPSNFIDLPTYIFTFRTFPVHSQAVSDREGISLFLKGNATTGYGTYWTVPVPEVMPYPHSSLHIIVTNMQNKFQKQLQFHSRLDLGILQPASSKVSVEMTCFNLWQFPCSNKNQMFRPCKSNHLRVVSNIPYF